MLRNESSTAEFFKSIATNFEDYGEFRLTKLEGDSGDFHIECFIKIDERPDFHRDWVLKCRGVKRSSVRLGLFDRIELSDEHVLLSEFQDDIGRLGFRGTSVEPAAVAGSLYQAHFNFADEWIPFGAYINGSDVIELLRGGFGVLAEGPIPFINTYRTVLEKFRIDTSITGIRRPSYWNGKSFGDIPKLQALLLDDFFIVAESFEAVKFDTYTQP